MPDTLAPVEVFCSYAHEDEAWRRKLEKHLIQLNRQKLISTWHDRHIRPGTDWEKEIDTHLNSASIILLLISADFLYSDYCTGIEMSRALERHGTGEARVIPIMLRHVDWQGAPFARLQMLPQDARPVATWEDHDLAFKNIAMQLRKVVEELQEPPMNNPHPQEELVQSNNPSNPQAGRTNDYLDRNVQQGPQHIPQASSHFRHCQEKVSELKNVHNMLHEIEVQLEGLSETIQRVVRVERQVQKEETNQHFPDFDYIEIAWQRAVPKIEDLAYFAAEEMKTLEQERFSFDNDVIRGPSWVKDLFIRQRAFEVEVEDRNIVAIKKLSNELLTKCRYHLYHIDRRLLSALKELDAASNLIVRNRT